MQGLNVDMPVAPVMGAYGGGGDDNFFKYLILLAFSNNGGLFGGNREAGTVEAIATEGNWTATMNKLDGITQGLSSLGYANLEGQNAINLNMSNGFNGVNNAICSSSWNISRELMGLSSSMAACCCETNRNIDSVRYDMSRGFCDVVTAGNNNTRDIIAAQAAGTQRIVDIMNNNTIQDLRDENQALKLQASQLAQTANIESYVNNAITSSTETILKHIPFILKNNGCCY